jgi:hypothetical protein
MYIARQISTKQWINDFQSFAKPETLIANAIAAGYPEGDVEVVDVTPVEYETIKESIIAPLRAVAEAEAELTRQQLLTVLNQARTAWGFTKPQMKLLVQALRQVAEGDLD